MHCFLIWSGPQEKPEIRVDYYDDFDGAAEEKRPVINESTTRPDYMELTGNINMVIAFISTCVFYAHICVYIYIILVLEIVMSKLITTSGAQIRTTYVPGNDSKYATEGIS